jgi:hypothetical protein
VKIWNSVLFVGNLLALLATTAIGAFGQADTGTLLGTVVDPSQAVVPGTTVTILPIAVLRKVR